MPLNKTEAPEGYEARESLSVSSCKGCALGNNLRLCNSTPCDAHDRTDGTSVIFVKIEDSGIKNRVKDAITQYSFEGLLYGLTRSNGEAERVKMLALLKEIKEHLEKS